MSAIHRVLVKAKLTQYEQKVLEQGADDLDQLREVSDSDFQQLLEAIGMASKPFHVMRFRNAIGRTSLSICKSSSASPSLSIGPTSPITISPLSVHPEADTRSFPSNLLTTPMGAESKTQASAFLLTYSRADTSVKERTDSSGYLCTYTAAEAKSHACTTMLNHPASEPSPHPILPMSPEIDTRNPSSSMYPGLPNSPHQLPPLGRSSGSSAHTVTVFATQYTEPSIGSSPANGEPTSHAMIEGLVTRPDLLVSSVADTDEMSSSSLPTTQKDCQTETSAPFENIFPEQLQQLVDGTTPVQLGLCPSPINPSIWDESRKKIIREGSQIFKISLEVGSKRRQSELAHHEMLINEASYTLCLWDPTLLVRREELFTLAKKLVKLTSTAASGSNEQYSFRLDDGVKKSAQPYPLQRGPDGKFQNCFQMNYELRERQIAQLEQLLAENVAEEQVKQVLLSDAKRRKDFSMILQLQESISVLGQNYKDLRYQLSQMKKKQRRGVKFQERKKAQMASCISKPLVTSFPTSPLLPQLVSTSSLITPSQSAIGNSMQVDHAVAVQPFQSSSTPVQQQQQEAVTVILDKMDTSEQSKTSCGYLEEHATHSQSSV